MSLGPGATPIGTAFSPKACRVFQAMTWSAQDVSPLTPRASNNFSIFVVQSQSATENDDSSYRLSHKRVIGLAKLLWITGESRIWIRTTHDAVKRVAGLSSGIDVAAGKSKIVGAEGICRIRLLRGNQATAWPFRTPIRASKHDSANYAIAIHHRAPFLVPESAVRSLALFDSARQRRLELVVVRDASNNPADSAQRQGMKTLRMLGKQRLCARIL